MSKPLTYFFAAFAVLAIVAGCHGCRHDIILDDFDNGHCFLCRLYGVLQSDNAAFEVRQSRRAEEKP